MQGLWSFPASPSSAQLLLTAGACCSADMRNPLLGEQKWSARGRQLSGHSTKCWSWQLVFSCVQRVKLQLTCSNMFEMSVKMPLCVCSSGNAVFVSEQVYVQINHVWTGSHGAGLLNTHETKRWPLLPQVNKMKIKFCFVLLEFYRNSWELQFLSLFFCSLTALPPPEEATRTINCAVSISWGCSPISIKNGETWDILLKRYLKVKQLPIHQH